MSIYEITAEEVGSVTAPVPAVGDALLLQRIRSGERRALDVVWHHYARPVLALALSRLDRREDAEEVAQDVFVTLWRRREQIELAGSSLLPWLLVTCRNLVANAQRRLAVQARQLSDTPLDDATPGRAEQPDAAAERDELRRVVAAAVDALPPTDRELFRLCLVDGRSYDEAAEALGLSNASIRNRLSRLRSRLRSELHTLRGTR